MPKSKVKESKNQIQKQQISKNQSQKVKNNPQKSKKEPKEKQIQKVQKEGSGQKRSGVGKDFENRFSKWYEKTYQAYVLKIPDASTMGWKNQGITCFATKPPFDFFCLSESRSAEAYECKSTNQKSITFTLVQKRGDKHSYQIKPHQIKGLMEFHQKGKSCAFLLLEFRESGKIYRLPIQVFYDWAKKTNKKSISEKDVIDLQSKVISFK